MTNTLKNDLQAFGLSKTESKIYLFLLQEGLASPPRIAEGTGIARTNTYNVLTSLTEKGLITEQKQGARSAYVARDPEALLERLNEQKESIERVLPDLRALHTVQKNKPSIQFFSGWDQVKEIYRSTYSAKEVFAIGSTKRLVDLDEAFFRSFEQEYKKRQIILNDILTESSRDIAEDQTKQLLKGYYNAAFLPSSAEMQTDMLIWDDAVALISLEEPIFGTVIRNGAVATSFRTLCQTLTSTLKD